MITPIPPPSNLTYSSNPAVYTKGDAITANAPSHGGGAVSSYSVAPALPAGLILNPGTGVITGTPVAISATANHIVIATNSGGSTTVSLSITVNDVAPSDLSFSANPATYVVGSPITANSPSSSGGAVVSYSVSPTLPAGLSLDTRSGVISGTPTTVATTAVYTVTATNSGGNATASLSITIVDSAPSNLTYTYLTATFTTGVAIPMDTPAHDGGTVSSYSVSPALPLGLSLDPATGVISGTPTTITAQATYTVTADNSKGSASVDLSFTVVPPGPVISIEPADTTSAIGGTAAFSVTASGATALNYQWQRNHIDISGATDAIYTSPALTSGDNGTYFRVVVADAYGSTATSRDAVLTVTGGEGFVATGSMNMKVVDPTAVLLSDGKVLVVGGTDPISSDPLQHAEVYDPASGTFTTTNNMVGFRGRPLAALLPNGKVLIAGGSSHLGTITTAELYDPANHLFTATGSMPYSPGTTATLLPNGKVLIPDSGGAQMQVYDPASGTFSTSPGLSGSPFSATLLQNGKVLLKGAVGSWIYDPATGVETATGAPPATMRWMASATLLPNGKVLFAGGYYQVVKPIPPYTYRAYLASTELYDPVANTFTASGSMFTQRYNHAATLLPNGKILITDGYNGTALESAELYDPITGTFTPTGHPLTPRIDPTATLLLNGQVLVVGGSDSTGSAELYSSPAAVPSGLDQPK